MARASPASASWAATLHPTRWLTWPLTSTNAIPVGPYIAHLGPLQSSLCNQHMLKRQPDGTFTDITARFRRKAT